MNSRLVLIRAEYPTSAEIKPRNGVLALSGYGIKVIVEGGHLIVEDGVGSSRRNGRFSRAAAGFRRLVILGHSGIVSLEALRWLNGIGASIVQIDSDGEVIMACGPSGLDDARLGRAQALATINGSGLEIAKNLVRRKLADQAELLYSEFPNSTEDVLTIRFLRQRIDEAPSIEKLRELEAQAASIYWSAWHNLPVRFIQKDAGRVPVHWLEFRSRSSPISKPSPRRAGNPANALLNYVYAIVEAECRIAALRVGLDPAIGVMHSDLRARDSLACDLMEPIRPKADALVFDTLKRREFRKADFFETREGVCRLFPPVVSELTENSAQFSKAIGVVAEDVAQRLFRSSKELSLRPLESKLTPVKTIPSHELLPTPLSQSNRRNGKEAPAAPLERERSKPRRSALPCFSCGKEIDGNHRAYCTACLVPLAP